VLSTLRDAITDKEFFDLDAEPPSDFRPLFVPHP
jgi:hypothetical protein